jgi:transcriptional regulator with XRE-family HTH domain
MTEIPSDPEAFGSLLRRLRIERGVSPKQLRSVCVSELSRIECGHRLPRLKTLVNLLSELGHKIYLEVS